MDRFIFQVRLLTFATLLGIGLIVAAFQLSVHHKPSSLAAVSNTTKTAHHKPTSLTAVSSTMTAHVLTVTHVPQTTAFTTVSTTTGADLDLPSTTPRSHGPIASTAANDASTVILSTSVPWSASAQRVKTKRASHRFTLSAGGAASLCFAVVIIAIMAVD